MSSMAAKTVKLIHDYLNDLFVKGSFKILRMFKCSLLIN